MPVWLMVTLGVLLVGLVISYVIIEWRTARGTRVDRRGGSIDPAERRREGRYGDGPGDVGAGSGGL